MPLVDEVISAVNLFIQLVDWSAVVAIRVMLYDHILFLTCALLDRAIPCHHCIAVRAGDRIFGPQ